MSRAWKGGSTSRWRKIREAVLKRDGCCQMCGQSEGQMHIDHVIPKRLGGGDEIWNLRQLCAKCNLSKGGRFFEADGTPGRLDIGFFAGNSSTNPLTAQ
jgi:5-methylcytosine-specific restriction endonuclease McrA